VLALKRASDRCHAFQDRDYAAAFGKASDWLAKATESGQPAAQATMVAHMLQQQLDRNFLRAGAASTPDNSAELIGNNADPTDMIKAAVQSGDPEALLQVGWDTSSPMNLVRSQRFSIEESAQCGLSAASRESFSRASSARANALRCG